MVELATREWGEAGGPVAVLVHGVAGSSRTWNEVGPALAVRGFQVIAVDLRGHGASPPATASTGLEELAEDVLDTVGPSVDVLVGHSLGALTVLTLAAGQPDVARRLVLEDPPGSQHDWQELADDIEREHALALDDPAQLRRELLGPPANLRPQDAERKVLEIGECQGDVIAAVLRQGVDFDLAAMGRAIAVPALLLLGEEELGSALLGTERDQLASSFAQGTTHVFPCGHSVHREALDDYMDVLTAWLEQDETLGALARASRRTGPEV